MSDIDSWTRLQQTIILRNELFARLIAFHSANKRQPNGQTNTDKRPSYYNVRAKTTIANRRNGVSTITLSGKHRTNIGHKTGINPQLKHTKKACWSEVKRTLLMTCGRRMHKGCSFVQQTTPQIGPILCGSIEFSKNCCA